MMSTLLLSSTSHVNFDAHGNHERAGSEYLAPPALLNNKQCRRGEVLRARFMESPHVLPTRIGHHEPYSGRDGAPPPSAQRNGRTVDSVALRHRGRGRRRSAVPTWTEFREGGHV